jgi:hypothetical protein
MDLYVTDSGNNGRSSLGPTTASTLLQYSFYYIVFSIQCTLLFILVLFLLLQELCTYNYYFL